MLSDRQALLTLHRRWLVGTVVLTLAAVAVYVSAARDIQRLPGGSSPVGLAFGGIAAAIILFECALVLRRTWLLRTFRGLGSAQFWMKAHIWLGLLAVPLVLMHSGFHWGGWLSTFVAGSFALVTASGIFGLVMQTVLPRKMLELLPEETIHAQIDDVARQLADDARRLVGLIDAEELLGETEGTTRRDVSLREKVAAESEGPVVSGFPRHVGTIVERVPRPDRELPAVVNVPKALQDALLQDIEPFLLSGDSPRYRLHSPQRSSWYFEELRRRIDVPDAQIMVTTLERFCETRRQMNLQRRLHFWLHSWLHLHVPLAAVLLTLLLGHIVFAWRYS